MKSELNELFAPAELKSRLRLEPELQNIISSSKEKIKKILRNKDDRLLVIIGPCSVHDIEAAVELAQLISESRRRFSDTLEIVMRVYVEKPRTVKGWKGLINDPWRNDQCDIGAGVIIARKLFLEIVRTGVPVGTECLSPLVTSYIDDLIAWGSIGARTTESQVHRELASGLSFPIGFKNNTEGNVAVAINSVLASSLHHNFISINQDGRVSVSETEGNADCHLVLRGGREPNYDSDNIRKACSALQQAGLEPRVVVDVSHANSMKIYTNQIRICNEIAERISNGERSIAGIMIESNLAEGAQGVQGVLEYGKSITDACISWKDSVSVLTRLAEAVVSCRSESKKQPL